MNSSSVIRVAPMPCCRFHLILPRVLILYQIVAHVTRWQVATAAVSMTVIQTFVRRNPSMFEAVQLLLYALDNIAIHPASADLKRNSLAISKDALSYFG